MNAHRHGALTWVSAAALVIATGAWVAPAASAADGTAPTWQRQPIPMPSGVTNGGWYSSLAIDDAGHPHVAYRENNAVVKYAWYDGTKWIGQKNTDGPDVIPLKAATETPSVTSTGYLLSLALDASGKPAIAFTTQQSDAFRLRFAHWTGSAWDLATVASTTPIDWSKVTPLPPANQRYQPWTGMFPDLAYNDGMPFISYVECRKAIDSRSCTYGAVPYTSGDGRLMYATQSESGWTSTAVDQGTETDPPTVSVDGIASMAFDNAAPGIAYFDRAGRQLKYASLGASGWSTEQVATINQIQPDRIGIALAFDASHVPHIAYTGGASQVRYATPGGVGWTTTALALWVSSYNIAGQGPKLVIDPTGLAHIGYIGSYGTPSHATAMYATWNGSTVTTQPVADPADGAGDWYPDFALDKDGRARMSYWVRQSSSVTTGKLLYAHLNAPPAATNDEFTTSEDTPSTIDAVSNDEPGYGFSGALTLKAIKTAPTNGTASIESGKIAYQGKKDYSGTDSLVYTVCDANGAPELCSDATVNITVTPVNDAPTVTVDPPSATVVYGDPAAPISVTGADVDNELGSLTFTAAGLPAGLELTPNGDGTATIDGTPTAAKGVYNTTVTVWDPDGAHGEAALTVTVSSENVVVRPAQSNPHAVSTTGTAPDMTFTARITEEPDGYYDVPGHLADAKVTFRLDGMTPGGSNATCDGTVVKTVAATATTPAFIDVSCTFGAGLPVDVYELTVTVSGDNYVGTGYSGLTVFTPGGTNPQGGAALDLGGGVTGSVNYTAKFLKSKQVQGRMLVVLTTETSQLVLKGNVMSTMSVNLATGTVVITGKATLNGVGNYKYTLTAIDSGNGDQVGLKVLDPTGQPVPALTFGPVPIADGDLGFATS